jgi:hypothetical protein
MGGCFAGKKEYLWETINDEWDDAVRRNAVHLLQMGN